MENILQVKTGVRFIMAEDFNLDLNKLNSSNHVNDYVNLMLTYSFKNVINVPTYILIFHPSDALCVEVDHMWHNLNITEKSYIAYPSLADHYFIAIVF